LNHKHKHKTDPQETHLTVAQDIKAPDEETVSTRRDHRGV
jgi:hypothetical protein